VQHDRDRRRRCSIRIVLRQHILQRYELRHRDHTIKTTK
jgi:hypothetical protein